MGFFEWDKLHILLILTWLIPKKKKKSLSQWQTNIIHEIPLNIYINIYIYIKAKNEKNKIKRLENWASESQPLRAHRSSTWFESEVYSRCLYNYLKAQ